MDDLRVSSVLSSPQSSFQSTLVTSPPAASPISLRLCVLAHFHPPSPPTRPAFPHLSSTHSPTHPRPRAAALPFRLNPLASSLEPRARPPPTAFSVPDIRVSRSGPTRTPDAIFVVLLLLQVRGWGRVVILGRLCRLQSDRPSTGTVAD